ncbi:MAG: dicarboxylate/amino acid:cation symporter [Sphingomonadales bacterium]|nr:dicarboxylate/amino acid:cation symporter [Sphingomonadales bacterium]
MSTRAPIHSSTESIRSKGLPVHLQILSGLVTGVLFGILSSYMGWNDWVVDWIKPLGTLFVNLLKLIAAPLVLASLVVGVSGLSDVGKLSRLGGRTIALYMSTTVLAISIGLLVVNWVQPGQYITPERRDALKESFSSQAESKAETARQVTEQSPLQPLVDTVPSNIFDALTDNTQMLQVVFFALFFGIGIILLPRQKTAVVRDFFEAVNEIILKLVELIMKGAPLGVFALLASLVADFAGDDPRSALELLQALGAYSLTVVVGLAVVLFLVYPAFLWLGARYSIAAFFKGMAPAQLLAFSTSSSSATLPVTLERVEQNLGVSGEVAGFVLPLGATINMDGTSLYQAVATVFIAQAFGVPLDWGDQLTIILTATLASIGSAGVPGAGMVMLVVVLESVGLDPAGIALIMAVDRILDMARTVVNVSGDAMVAVLVARKTSDLNVTHST